MDPYTSEGTAARTDHRFDPTTLWRRWVRLAVDLQRAALTAWEPTPSDGGAPEPLPTLAWREQEWSVERTAETQDELEVGTVVTFAKRLTDADVREFARASGDTNRLHLEDEFARETRFGERIAHGTLVSGVISAALARLPGLTIYLSQDLEFLGPVPIGERVTATCEVVEALGDGRFRLTTAVADEDGQIVIDGEAIVLVDPRPGETDDAPA